MTDNEFDQCVAGFYQAASGQVDWGQALRAMHEAFSLWAIHIFGLDMASGTITFSFEVGGTAGGGHRFRAHLASPRPAYATGAAAGRRAVDELPRALR